MTAAVCILFVAAMVSPMQIVAFIAYGLALLCFGFLLGFRLGRQRQRRSRAR